MIKPNTEVKTLKEKKKQIPNSRAEWRISMELTRRERSLESAETLLKKTIADNNSLKTKTDRERSRVCMT